jgi:hypothetical protein
MREFIVLEWEKAGGGGACLQEIQRRLRIGDRVAKWALDSCHLDDGGDTVFRNVGSHKRTTI